MPKKHLVIGTRKSALAMHQANWVKSQLILAHPDLSITFEHIVTRGDKITDVALNKVGGKGLFTKEIEEALLAKTVDLAVHSMKDLPTELPQGLILGATPKREDARDVLVAPCTFKDLPSGARVGTSSLRRQAQILAIRPDLKLVSVRGNLDTRLRKRDEGAFDALILAAAGLKRLGLAHRIQEFFDPAILCPAVGQGALGIEIRSEDEDTLSILALIHDSDTMKSVIAERSLLKALGGGCQTPIGAFSHMDQDGKIYLYGVIASLDGKRIVRSEKFGHDPLTLGADLATDLLAQGGSDILAEILG